MRVTRDIQTGSLVITQEEHTRGLFVMYGMQDYRPWRMAGYDKELSLMQPEDYLLGEEVQRDFNLLVARYDIL